LLKPPFQLFSVALFSHGDNSPEQSEPGFWLALKRCNLAVALPKLNVVAVDKLLRFFYGLIVVDGTASLKWPSWPTRYARYSGMGLTPKVAVRR
jgi:hypothetical protein